MTLCDNEKGLIPSDTPRRTQARHKPSFHPSPRTAESEGSPQNKSHDGALPLAYQLPSNPHAQTIMLVQVLTAAIEGNCPLQLSDPNPPIPLIDAPSRHDNTRIRTAWAPDMETIVRTKVPILHQNPRRLRPEELHTELTSAIRDCVRTKFPIHNQRAYQRLFMWPACVLALIPKPADRERLNSAGTVLSTQQVIRKRLEMRENAQTKELWSYAMRTGKHRRQRLESRPPELHTRH